MSSFKPFVIAGILAAATLFSASPSNAIGLSAGASSARLTADDVNIVKAQYQRRVVRRAPVARHAVHSRRSASNRRAIAAGVGAVAAIGVIGAVAAANARPARQHYVYDRGYHPSHGYFPSHGHHPSHGFHRAAAPVYAQPVCRVRNEELFNRNGVYRGVFQVQDCR
jgi:hypothetical protein